VTSQPTRLGVSGRPPGTGQSSLEGARGAEDQADPARILIVEDDFLIAMQTEAALIEAGFCIVGTAATAEGALVLASNEHPSLAVMDIRLASRRDGIDAARKLFHDLGIRCIFATAHDDPYTRNRAEPYAPLGWLAKPYTMESLVALVAEALRKLDSV
jgi:DNA-binding NarL/FixJ family response regulator